MLNASSFLVFYRWKPIETLFYTVISVIKFDTNTSVQPNTTEAPTFRQWEVERLNFLCTVIVPHLFAVIILLAFLANTLVICVIIGKKKLRTPLNVFFINLAISDIILVVFGLPFIAYRYAAETWLLGEVICRMHHYATMTTIFVSVYTMVAVSVFRYRLLTNNDTAGNTAECRHSIFCVAVIWIIMLLLNAPILLLYSVKTKMMPSREIYNSCELQQEEMGRSLFLAFFILTYALPLTIAIMCHSIIIITLRKRSVSSAFEVAARNYRRRNLRVTLLLVTVLVAFTLCWLPLHVQLLLAFSGSMTQTFGHEVFRVLTFCLAYSSTFVNAIIYSFVCAEFRESLFQIIHPLTKCIPCFHRQRNNSAIQSANMIDCEFQIKLCDGQKSVE